MPRKYKFSYWNVAARNLMRVQRGISAAKVEGGISGLLKQRILEETLEWMRFRYGQPSALDNLFVINRYRSVASGLTFQGVPLFFDEPIEDGQNVVTYATIS